MYPKWVLIVVLAATIKISKSVLVDKGKFEPIKPSPIDELPEERRLVNFKDQTDDNNNDRHRSEKETKIKEDSEKAKDSKQEKSKRTFSTGHPGADGADNPNCCGSRYEGSPGRPEAGHGSGSGGLRASSDTGRYQSHYGIRPEDRYGWQSYTPGLTGRRGSVASAAGSGSSSGGGGLYGNGQSGGDRYGSRPYHDGDNEYNRPGNSGNRPGRPSYGYGYGDSGAYGSTGYEVSRPGSYGSSRPSTGGINFGSSRPGGSGPYGGGTYGSHGGVYGHIGGDDEYAGQEAEPEPEAPASPPVNNLQTQKAVALKALAGVALIGAAAALASNPVLLPLGVLAGRKKRDVDSYSGIEDIDVGGLTKLVEDSVPEIYRVKITKGVLTSPECIARLACEVQQEYITERGNKSPGDNENSDNVYNGLKRRLINLIQSKILHADIRYKNIRKLVKSAGTGDGNCEMFFCNFTKD